MRSDFALLIISHGRAGNVLTLQSMRDAGYTGNYYIILDNEDSSIDEYRSIYGEEHVVVFDKQAKAKQVDTFDNFDEMKVSCFARNSCFEIAKSLGLKYFLELDDDYVIYRRRFVKDNIFTSYIVKDMDSIIDEMIEFLNTTKALTVAFAQTGDFIGGMGSRVYKQKITRKAMNAFFCDVDRPFEFGGRFNEDVTAYAQYGVRGELMFTIADISLEQQVTQAVSGGLTEAYKTFGTYVKSFYSVIACPSCVKISTVGTTDLRIHHNVDWEHCTPKIISSRFKK